MALGKAGIETFSFLSCHLCPFLVPESLMWPTAGKSNVIFVINVQASGNIISAWGDDIKSGWSEG